MVKGNDKRMLSISVAMATYNGEKYLREQIDSILCQLAEQDEIIISDDGSMDSTLLIIEEYMKKDNRIHLVKGLGKGHVFNFENAIKFCKNEIIVLSDQDDVWENNKISELTKSFYENPNIVVVNHGAKLIDEKGKDILQDFNSKYYGCCMAVRQEYVKSLLPFPKWTVAHDQLIAYVALIKKKYLYVDSKLLKRRIHNGNLTSKAKCIEKIIFRIKSYSAVLYEIFKKK